MDKIILIMVICFLMTNLGLCVIDDYCTLSHLSV